MDDDEMSPGPPAIAGTALSTAAESAPLAAQLCSGPGLLFLGGLSSIVCAPLAIHLWNTRTGERAFGLGRWSTRSRRLLSLGLQLVPIVLLGLGLEPFAAPERYVPTLERTSAPLIAAIDRFTAEHGAPPTELDELVPGYLSAIPGTGYRGDPSFHYGCWRPTPSGQQGWELCVDCEPPLSIFYGDTLRIVSTDRRWRWIEDRD